MPAKFRRIALIGKYQTIPSVEASQTSRAVVDDVALFLARQGCEAVVDTDTSVNLEIGGLPALTPNEIGQQCDLCIAIGGDGTMLGISRQLARYGTPMIGINQGRLGFVTDLPLDGYQEQLAPMLHGVFDEDLRPLIHARIIRDGQGIHDAHALNDVVLSRGGISGMLEIRMEVSGQFVSNQRADGLIIATPTGSTAYTLSVGGPIVHPATAGWVVAPIAPHKLSNRPLVLPDSSEIAVEVLAGRDMTASFDMQSYPGVLLGDRLLVNRSEFSARFLHPKGWNYYAMLRSKLGWNVGGS